MMDGKPYYRYRYTKDGLEYGFGAKNIQELEKKVKEKGLEWRTIDKETTEENLDINK